MVDLTRFAIAVCSASVFWVLGLGSVLRRLRDQKSSVHGNRKPSLPRRVFLIILVGSFLAVPYAFFEPYWPEVTHTTIETDKLTPGQRVRIVQLSDLHSDPSAWLEDEIPRLVANEHPDLVVFTGDAINSEDALPVFRRCLRGIASQAPTYGVKGNWEAWWFEDVDVFEGTGAVELDGRGVPLKVRDVSMWLGGAAVENEGAIRNSLRGASKAGYAIFLHHFPAMAEKAMKDGADLHLAGDTHGGQLRLPLLNELIRIARYGVWKSTGLHEVAGGHLYVNRGIGMEGGLVPRVRFGCRPEIAVIDIVGN